VSWDKEIDVAFSGVIIPGTKLDRVPKKRNLKGQL
jgi:hypothetical protein